MKNEPILLMLLVLGSAALVALPLIEAAHAVVLRQESRQRCDNSGCFARSSSSPNQNQCVTTGQGTHSIRTICRGP
jgi:hypothetical protein